MEESPTRKVHVKPWTIQHSNQNETMKEDTETKPKSSKQLDDDNNNNIVQDSHAPETSHAKEETPKEEDPKTGATLTRPLKKARTAYFIFADEKRQEMQGIHQTACAQAKVIGQMWSNLTSKEKEVFSLKAAEERLARTKELELLQKSGMLPPIPETLPTNPMELTLPLSRIKKIIKLDPEVKAISTEAIQLICKSCELFTAELGKESLRIAQMQNRRKLLPEDVAEVCSGNKEPFVFLKEDLKDFMLHVQKERTMQQEKRREEKKVGEEQQTGRKSILTYFGNDTH